MHKDLAIGAVASYLTVVWCGMALSMILVRTLIKSGYFKVDNDPSVAEPAVVLNRAYVAKWSIGIASAALVVYLLCFRGYVSEGKSTSYASVAAIIFFGLSYAIYMAWPNKLYYSSNLSVHTQDINDGKPFDPSRKASNIVHLVALCASVTSIIIVCISGADYNVASKK